MIAVHGAVHGGCGWSAGRVQAAVGGEDPCVYVGVRAGLGNHPEQQSMCVSCSKQLLQHQSSLLSPEDMDG